MVDNGKGILGALWLLTFSIRELSDPIGRGVIEDNG